MNTITLPGGVTLTLPTLPTLPQLGQQQLTLPQQFSLPPNLLSGAQGGAPDLSGLLSALAPVIGAAVPQLAPFLPIIGVLFQILHTLSTQMNAVTASGTPNPSLQAVHDAAWQQVLSAFGQKPAALPAASSG